MQEPQEIINQEHEKKSDYILIQEEAGFIIEQANTNLYAVKVKKGQQISEEILVVEVLPMGKYEYTFFNNTFTDSDLMLLIRYFQGIVYLRE